MCVYVTVARQCVRFQMTQDVMVESGLLTVVSQEECIYSELSLNTAYTHALIIHDSLSPNPGVSLLSENLPPQAIISCGGWTKTQANSTVFM